MSNNSETVVVLLTREECKLIWDSFHTYYYVESSQNTLLKSEAELLHSLVNKFKELGYGKR